MFAAVRQPGFSSRTRQTGGTPLQRYLGSELDESVSLMSIALINIEPRERTRRNRDLSADSTESYKEET